ncbi:MAG: PKD domain-containing protein [Vicinamibacterales bacterium]
MVLAVVVALAGRVLGAQGQVNQAPTVSAGSAFELTMPAIGQLNGHVTDDGLPTGAPVTARWTQQSGPGTATFGSPTLASSTVSFSAPGDYVLRLTGSDGSLSSFSDVTVTVKRATPTNQAPTITLASTLSVTFPATGVLAGKVTDDGLPGPAKLTPQWTQVSGPGVATFTYPIYPTTPVTFSAPGVYVLRLTVSDGALSSVANITVTVIGNAPANKAPTVSAGANQTITLPAGASLPGTVTDDGLPQGAPVTSLWTRQSGPGAVTFANASSPSTTATFSTAGIYVLRLTASDTALNAFADVTITVNAAPPVNQAPIVTAGTNQTITLPAGATLAGSVTDDALPQGATVTSQWTQQSGSGTTTFADASNPSTTATFSVAGTYVLRLTASDTALTAFADVTITVNAAPPVNQAPVVTAGTNQTITLPAGATLAGSVTDDALPQGATVTSQWTQQSGPGTTTFADASSPSTTATFSTAGTYVLRLTASDTALTAFADVTITVNAAPPVNQAPVVTAGTNQTITLPAGATLAGSVTDDALPQGATVTSQWTQQSGPGTTTFADAGNPSTTATFSAAGTLCAAAHGERHGTECVR